MFNICAKLVQYMSRLFLYAFPIVLFSGLFLNTSCKRTVKTPDPAELAKRQHFSVAYGTPMIDGNGTDDAWQQAEWLPLDQLWIGKMPDSSDYKGRYKLLWDEYNLYLLAEITDDTLIDFHTDGLEHFWDDDCLVVFLDEDASGGTHEFSYNAFAYHIALDGSVADVAPDSSFRYFNDHCLTRRIARDNVSTWEIAVRIFDGKQYEDEGDNVPMLLRKGKKMGFALAYCDNDQSPERESFVGNVPLPNAEKKQHWQNADAFGTIELR